MRGQLTGRAGRALAVAALVLASGVGAAATSSADPGDPGHEHPTSTTTPPTPTTSLPVGTPPPGLRTTAIQYGPFTIPEAPTNPDGTHGHGHTGNQIVRSIQKPCTSCYVTGMRADLVYPDGTQANWSNDAQLHHMVLLNSALGRSDATCPAGVGALGQRFFASGDERTVVPTVGRYGYRVGLFDRWTLLYDLANHRGAAKDVLIKVTYEWVPATTTGMQSLEPVWLDLDQCRDSEISIPAGPSSHQYSWTANRSGRLMHLHGHIHDGGVNLTVDNATTGRRLCDSRAGYGETPAYIGHHGEAHISSMGICVGAGGTPIDTVRAGQRITLTANYNAPAAVDDAMGISILYLAPG